MKTLIVSFLIFPILLARLAAEAPINTALTNQLHQTYENWRQAVMTKDSKLWSQVTFSNRKISIQNRILSEKKDFPGAVFELPTAPPSTQGLKVISVNASSVNAKIAYYGTIDFGVGGAPTKNIMLLSFYQERGAWKYDSAEFVNLSRLPEVREQLDAGDYQYCKSPDFKASNVKPKVSVVIQKPAKYIAKVYVFCPGREVDVQVNRKSRHNFKNAKRAEIVIGGVSDQKNTVEYKIKAMEGGTGKEAMTVRVYLFSEIKGIKPIKVWEYQVEAGVEAKDSGQGAFEMTQELKLKLLGRK